MSSTFFGLNIANTGINAYQASINTTANNIANVETEGYSRQTTNLVASSALRVYSSYGSVSTGVTVESVTRDRNEYYDTKYWQNQSYLGMHETKLGQFKEIENYFIDDAHQTGFSTIFDEMFSALDSMKNNAGDKDYRIQFISNAENLCKYFKSVSVSLQEQQISINDNIKTVVDNINSISQKVAILTKEINVIEVENGNANELRDKRAALLDDLSYYVPIDVSENPVLDVRTGEPSKAHTFMVKINGQMLVDTYDFNTLNCVSKDYLTNQSDAEGLYDIRWVETGIRFDANSGNNSGVLKGLFDLRDGNNNTNVSGRVTQAQGTKITIAGDLTIDDPIKMNLPAGGYVSVNGKNFKYSSFEAQTVLDANGNRRITSYTFTLADHTLTNDEVDKITGRTLNVGQPIDTMGIPYYQNQLNEFLRSFTRAFNDLEKTGETLDGDDMGAFFVANLVDGTECEFGKEPPIGKSDEAKTSTDTVITSTNASYYQMTAQNSSVNARSRRDGGYFACATKDKVTTEGVDAYDLAEKLLSLQTDNTLFRGTNAASFLQCIYSDISVDTQESEIFYDNYNSMKTTITTQRDSVSSVDTDDEAMDLVKFQNAYNLSCKVISTLQEMYDQLILNTGV